MNRIRLFYYNNKTLINILITIITFGIFLLIPLIIVVTKDDTDIPIYNVKSPDLKLAEDPVH
ncbi:MAG: hypothetical protein ACK5LM_04575 [Lactovum sp.]